MEGLSKNRRRDLFMSQAEMFKKLAQKRQPQSGKKTTTTESSSTKSSTNATTKSTTRESREKKSYISTTPTTESTITETKKRGRPSTGKRSNPDWIGRTYYVNREVDLDVAEKLIKLKRQGIELDKSDLVNFLLAEWVKSQNGEKATFQIGENI